MLCALVLMGGVLLGQGEAAPDDALALRVRRLVRQLDAPTRDDREAAEEKLIGLGPAILDLLPQEPERISAEVRQRVRRIRRELQRASAQSAAEASLVTLQGELPLSKILAAIERETGNQIIYRPLIRQGTDPKLAVHFQKTPYWQALDQVLDQAGLGLRHGAAEKAPQVVPRTGTELPRAGRASYTGPFRFEAVMIQAARDLRRPQSGSLRVTLEASWEPRLAPVSLRQRMADVEATDENGRPLVVDQPDAVLEVPVIPGSPSQRYDVFLGLPPRGVKTIARLAGTLTALLPGKVETFRFVDLDSAKEVRRRVAGVTVVLERARKTGKLWEIRLRVRFDEAGEALQSHRTWIYDNEVYLEAPDGQRIRQFTSEPTLQTENEVGLAYFFPVDGPLKGYALIYKTPGLILSIDLDYELSNIELP